MIRVGENEVRGVPVDVERKRVRRINLRIRSDGRVGLSLPNWGVTLAEGEAFLLSKWEWVLKARSAVLSRPRPVTVVPDAAALSALAALLGELMALWTARLGAAGVTWKIRPMKSVWGSCHILRRRIVYNAELATVPRAHVEYVVVHELTHLAVANHGPRFHALMDRRLPGWKVLRRQLNRRTFG